MGYARYNTALGEAGYAVEDVCHYEGCTKTIDRGLDYLCGAQPGTPSEGGCGKWFCGSHLYMAPKGAEPVPGGGFCEDCIKEFEPVS